MNAASRSTTPRFRNLRRVCLRIALALGLSLSAVPGQSQSQAQGQWSSVENWPTRAVHASLLPDGRVFFVSYYSESMQPNIWDPVANTFAPTVAAPYLLFCAGHTGMADGRIFIAGGHIADNAGLPHALIYDPFQNKMTEVPDMNEGRWYPTTTVLPNGDILVVSGDVNSNTNVDPLPQVYQVASNSWRNLTSAQLAMPLYPVMLVAPNGEVFNAGPSPTTRYIDTSGTGAWTNVATYVFGGTRDYGPGLMYDVGKVLEVGGSDPPTATAETIDLTASSPVWVATGSMHFARRQHNAVILPDGTVLIVGGSNGSGFDDSTNPVLPTELWSPATGQFTVMASIGVYRGYHSIALLLPDGRVLSASGNVAGANAQVFSPPYLSAGARPTIASAPTGVGYGETVFIGTPDAASVSQVTFLRTTSTTHTFDQGGRFMHLSFTLTNAGLNVTMPANGNIAPPGYYMLFLLNSSGIPSVAKIIQITANGATTAILTGIVTNTSGAPLANVQVKAGSASANTAPDGTYTLTSVPGGSAMVTASRAGYQSASESVTVSVGGDISVPTIQLAPVGPGGITGTVVNSAGTAIAGASVTCAGLASTTNNGGAYTLSNVPRGSVTVAASASGFQPASETVAVTADNTVTAPALTLISNLGNVTGTVSSSNTPISGATVSFGGGTATTNASGVYSFTNIPVGTIQLVASAAGFQSVTQNVTVVAGSTITVNFTFATTPGTVTGTVTDISTAGVISGATVKWNTTSATANASGVYALDNVAGGTQTITASATGYLPVSSSVTVNGGTSTLNFKLSAAGILDVEVVTGAGAPVSGAPVALSGGIIATSLSGTTNASGVYSSNSIPTGNYTVTSGSVSATATVASGKTTTIIITQPGGPIPDFALSAANSVLQVNAGQSAQDSLQVAAINGFSGTVQFACSGLPAGLSCAFSPAAVSASMDHAASVQMTINAAATMSKRGPVRMKIEMLFAFCMGMFLVRKRNAVIFGLLSLMLLAGCQGLGVLPVQNTSSTTFPVQVNATSQNLQHSLTVNVSVLSTKAMN